MKEIMFPGSIERALGIAEASEWFDWMRIEMPKGGVGLPDEETAVLFTAHSLRLRDRVRDVYRHLPVCLEDRLIRSAIIYQCWSRHAKLRAKAKWPFALGTAPLESVNATRFVRAVGDAWGYYLVEAHDGFRYLITLPSGLRNETTPATEILCNHLASALGLSAPKVAVVIVEAALLRHVRDVRPGRHHRTPLRAPELCAGFRHVRPISADASEETELSPTPRSKRDLIGALVLDTWILNTSPRRWSKAFNEAKGRVEPIFGGSSDCLSGGDWGSFIDSTHSSLPAPQPIAAEVRTWALLEPWLYRIDHLDLNSIWELTFQMPPLWYGGSRPHITRVLQKLESRKWEMRRAMHYLIQVGYLPAMKISSSRSVTAPSTPAEIVSESA